MSKPISFGFGKPKASTTQNRNTPTPARNAHRPQHTSRSQLHDQSDDDEADEPRHESVIGFSSHGAVLGQSVKEKPERTINNPGNADWRRRGRGKNLLPADVQAQKQAEENGDVVMIERDEVSQVSGLQYADKRANEQETTRSQNRQTDEADNSLPKPELTADEEALEALLDGKSGKPKSSATITQPENRQLNPRDEVDDFRSDLALRPESSTLEEYASMPIEEFGMAMLRGMGKKRRANGEIIRLDGTEGEGPPVKVRKQEGFLGIGAKAAPGMDTELGAWGKADMRKNNKGQGYFTPLMRENNVTGERLTEEEFQNKLKESKETKGEEDWRARRDRNLGKDGRERDRRDVDSDGSVATNGHTKYDDRKKDRSDSHSSRRRREDSDYDSSPIRRSNQDYEDENSSSRRHRSRSRDRRKDRDHHHNAHRSRRHEEDYYDSSSSRRSGNRDRGSDR